jgi:hypothetical protein
LEYYFIWWESFLPNRFRVRKRSFLFSRWLRVFLIVPRLWVLLYALPSQSLFNNNFSFALLKCIFLMVFIGGIVYNLILMFIWLFFFRILELPKTTLKGPRATLKGPRATLKGPRATLKGPRATLKGPRTTLKGPRATLKGPRTTLKGRRTTLKGPRATLKGPRTTLKGFYRALILTWKTLFFFRLKKSFWIRIFLG